MTEVEITDEMVEAAAKARPLPSQEQIADAIHECHIGSVGMDKSACPQWHTAMAQAARVLELFNTSGPQPRTGSKGRKP